MHVDAWRARQAEIHSKFFRSGLYTHLWIDPDTSDGKVKWRYHFMDLGMCNSIEREFSTEEIAAIESEEKQLEFVFGGHYDKYVEELYAEFLHG